jgi:hypothetical protein
MRILHTVLVIAILLVAIALGISLWPEGDISHPPGVLVPSSPQQIPIKNLDLGERHGFRLTAVAEFRLKARVLHCRRYHSDWQRKLVPIDVALGWGPMSDEAVLDQLRIKQANRAFYYEWRGTPPLPKNTMREHASNMHLIAATEDISRRIRNLRKGTLAEFEGYLVNARNAEGMTWNTSLSRQDEGNGACELFYVRRLSVEN